MKLRIVAASLVPLLLIACGVKSDLDRPMGQIVHPQQQSLINPQKDPSKPPIPLGEPGGTTSPYPIGP